MYWVPHGHVVENEALSRVRQLLRRGVFSRRDDSRIRANNIHGATIPRKFSENSQRMQGHQIHGTNTDRRASEVGRHGLSAALRLFAGPRLPGIADRAADKNKNAWKLKATRDSGRKWAYQALNDAEGLQRSSVCSA
ncbi:hypothetical protein V2G26_021299 [Clonostachys chloroleuca]